MENENENIIGSLVQLYLYSDDLYTVENFREKYCDKCFKYSELLDMFENEQLLFVSNDSIGVVIDCCTIRYVDDLNKTKYVPQADPVLPFLSSLKEEEQFVFICVLFPEGIVWLSENGVKYL